MRYWILFGFVIGLHIDFAITASSDVYKLVYQDINGSAYDKCVRLLNGTHQVGCQSKREGNVGVLYHANTSSAIENFFTNTSSRNYVILLEASLFDISLVRRLKKFGKVSGLIVYEPSNFEVPDWSPDLQCPSERIGLYGPEYGSQYAGCSRPRWNPLGNGLTEEDIPFPVFYTDKATARDPLLDCYYNHNQPPEIYPLCAVEMRAWMHGAVSAISCYRRQQIQFSLNPVGFCDVMGGRNIIASLKQFTESYEEKTNSTILVTAPIDSRSFMATDTAPGVNEATAFISLLGVSYALGRLSKKEKESLSKNIMFVLFDAEAFDNIGSSRMVFDMEQNNFPVVRNVDKIQPPSLTLQNLSAVIELRQLGMAQNMLYAHYDSEGYRRYQNTKIQIDNMLKVFKNSSLFNVRRQSDDIGLAPSSLHSILVKNTSIPGIVLSDYDARFKNTHYFSRHDNLKSLNISWNKNASDNEILSKFEVLAQRLSAISTLVAQSIYRLASSNQTPPSTVTMPQDVMAKLLFCYLYKPNCSLFQEHLNFHSEIILSNESYNRYVSVHGIAHPITNVTQSLLADFVGERLTNFTTCKNPNSTDERVGYFYQKGVGNTPVCILSSSFITDAYPQNFLRGNYYDFANSSGMWAESQWAGDSFRFRIFLIQEEVTQGLIFLAGVLVFLSSFFIVWFLNKNAGTIFHANQRI